MSSIVSEWLMEYQKALVDLVQNGPVVGRYKMVEAAKNTANKAVPEGGEVLRELAKATYNKKGGGPVDAFSVALGRQIVQGLKAVNRDVIGGANLAPVLSGPEEAALGIPPSPAELKGESPEQVLRRYGPAPELAKAHVRRPTRTEAGACLDLYCQWADNHPYMPGDELLGHFTAWGRTTWAKARAGAEERGYKFEVKPGKAVGSIKVTGRPTGTPAPAPAEDRLARVEAMLAQLLKNGNGAKRA